MWDRTTIDMGNVKENTTLAFSFFHTGVISETVVTPSCGCTSVRWFDNTNTLTGNVSVGRFPAHLKKNGLQTFQFMKTITVSYIQDKIRKTDILIIKATLI
jgi:hypothetical protein